MSKGYAKIDFMQQKIIIDNEKIACVYFDETAAAVIFSLVPDSS